MMRVVHILALLCGLFLMQAQAQQVSDTPLEWPKAPEQARIRFLYAITGKKDLNIKKSIWKVIVEFFFGEETEHTDFIRPQNVAVDAKGRIYVTDLGLHAIHICDVENRDYDLFTGDDTVSFSTPTGIAVADNGWLYVSDPDRGVIRVFDDDRDYAFSITRGLQRPAGLCIRDSVLYVADTRANQIVAFDLKGNERGRFGTRGTGNGEFNYPIFLATRRAADDAGSATLHVVDAMNFRVEAMRRDGAFVSSFGSPGDGIGNFSRPKGVAIDSDGHIYVADGLYDVVQIRDRQGALLLAFGGSGSRFGTFNVPIGLCMDSRDRLYVVDSENHRVQVFQYLK